MIGAITNLEAVGEDEVYLPVTAGRHFLAAIDFPDQPALNDFEVQECQSPQIFVLVSVTEPISLLVCPAPRTYAHYQMAVKNKLGELLCVEEIRVPVFSVFVVHRNLQHGRRGWCASEAYGTTRT